MGSFRGRHADLPEMHTGNFDGLGIGMADADYLSPAAGKWDRNGGGSAPTPVRAQ